ncbi:MAG: hypothetical protein EU536_00225 [Promethearchaeota archaeon]|nr:MAG: hypothetical protein EU536_00225 [Candidatus Lokiarchaeota archaeon]
MNGFKKKATLGLLFFIFCTPTVLFSEVESPPVNSYNPFLFQNDNLYLNTLQFPEPLSTAELLKQKLSLTFQSLLQTTNSNEIITCFVVLQDQPTEAIAIKLKATNLVSDRVALRKAIFAETRTQVQNAQSGLIPAIAKLGGTILHKYTVINALLVEIPLLSLPALAELAQVARIEPDYQLTIQLDVSQPIILNTTPPGWDYAYNGTGIFVAVCDTGINKTHPALIGRVINESNFVSGEGVDDLDGHGTHVAGIIASMDNTYTGIGVNISLVNVKIMGQGGTGDTSKLIKGVEWLLMNTSHAADVINLSAGTSSLVADGDSSISRFVDAIVSSYNIVWVNAAGNSGSIGIEIPGDARNCISVANFDDHNTPNPSIWTIASSSSKGPTDDGRKKPDIAAPGTNIWSCNNDWEIPLTPDFVQKSGTSMAAPHVAGAAALILQYLQPHHADLQTDHALLTKGVLLHTALDIETAGYDYASGFGACDLGAAWNFLQSGHLEVESLTPSYSIAKYGLNITTSEIINITLLWNRKASTDFTWIYYSTLANIDIRLKNATGFVVASSSSSVDNIEQISYNATSGEYFLYVTVVDFSGLQRQEFALLSDSPIILLAKIRTWTLFEIILTVSIVGIIAVAAIYIVLWLRERSAKPIEDSYTPPESAPWPEWSGEY